MPFMKKNLFQKSGYVLSDTSEQITIWNQKPEMIIDWSLTEKHVKLHEVITGRITLRGFSLSRMQQTIYAH